MKIKNLEAQPRPLFREIAVKSKKNKIIQENKDENTSINKGKNKTNHSENSHKGLSFCEQGYAPLWQAKAHTPKPSLSQIKSWFGPAQSLALQNEYVANIIPDTNPFSNIALDEAHLSQQLDLNKKSSSTHTEPATQAAPLADELSADSALSFSLIQDSILENSGIYSLLQHSMELGQPPMCNGFIGYATLALLSQNGLVAACMETVADDMLRAWIKLKPNQKNAPAEQLETMENSIIKFNLRKLFHQAAVATRYFGGCLIFIDTGLQNPESLKYPLNLTDKSAELTRGGLKGLRVIDPVNLSPGAYNSTNPLAPDYFEPQSWWVLGNEIHASRFIKLSSGELPILLRPSYNFFGIPAAQIIWDYVLHFQTDRTSNSRLLSKFSDTILKTSMSDILASGAATANLDARLRYMAQSRSNDGIFAIDKEAEDLVKVESSLSGVTDISRQDLEIICAINRTPAVKLLGISPSGFNSTGENEVRNYYDFIASQQEKILRSPIAQALHCLELHCFGNTGFFSDFEFNPLGAADHELENSTRKSNTDCLISLLSSGLLDKEKARTVVEAQPNEYLPGLALALKI